MRNELLSLVAGLILACVVSAAEESPAPAPEWKAGVASVVITPQRPIRMAGYAARKEPSEGTEQDLFAKALAIEDAQGSRLVMVTMDLIGVNGELRETVAAQVEDRYELPPSALVMNASHTHCGPAYTRDDARDYFDWLAAALVELVGQALGKLEPASLSYSHAKSGFAMNRRTPTDSGYKNHPNPDGLVDHVVPVLRVDDPAGNLRAVVFGYACHNTTIGFRKWQGDYAGYAQQCLQQDHPEAIAMFMMGCGADQNPYPRSELKYAQRHGQSLATAVEAALEVNQKTARHQRALHGPLRSVFETVDLAFTKEANRPDLPYPVQIVRFGDELCMIFLGYEVVIDYSLRLKGELTTTDGPAVWVAGYSNAYSGYIPSRRVLLEGGYEAISRPWDPGIEERVVGKVHELFGRLKSER